MIALVIVGFVAVFAFMAIPYRIFQAHKEGDAEVGDYAFIVFLVFLAIFTIVVLVYFQE
jgi:branched-subunit amino acid transport protein AzlD